MGRAGGTARAKVVSDATAAANAQTARALPLSLVATQHCILFYSKLTSFSLLTFWINAICIRFGTTMDGPLCSLHGYIQLAWKGSQLCGFLWRDIILCVHTIYTYIFYSTFPSSVPSSSPRGIIPVVFNVVTAKSTPLSVTHYIKLSSPPCGVPSIGLNFKATRISLSNILLY